MEGPVTMAQGHRTGPFFDHSVLTETVSHIWLAMGGEK
jgi:hypothetical protein